jgi:hypothetical protein
MILFIEKRKETLFFPLDYFFGVVECRIKRIQVTCAVYIYRRWATRWATEEEEEGKAKTVGWTCPVYYNSFKYQ